MPVFPKQLSKSQCISATSKNPNNIVCKWKDKWDVHILCSTYTLKIAYINKCDRSGNKFKIPQCIIDYNDNMGFVDKSNMQMSFNNSARKSIKWYNKFFYHLLDISVLNSGIAYSWERS